ncbi:MAG: right-handed parallel beta-helix repeat-containing protein [Ignavibacteriota bacterium]
MRKKLVYIALLLFVITRISSADYITPGSGKSWNLDSLVANSAGAVTFSGGEYFFNTNILLANSDTLKIRTNSTVKFQAAMLFTVYGTLLIDPPDSVKFTAIDTNSKYVGIRLDSLSDASVMRNLIFEHGNSIYFFYSNAVLDSSIIRYNTYAGTGARSGAVYMYQSNPIISNCKIYGNYRSAIGSGANIPSSPSIINNLIYGNSTANGNYPQINIGAGGPTPIVVRGNTFLRASTNAGAMAFSPIGSIPSLIVENNIIKNNRYGITITGGVTAYVNNNIIDSNNTQGLPTLGGSGLSFSGAWTSSSVICTRNTIRWNLWGVTNQNTAKPNLGNLTSPDTTDKGLNIIYGNGNTGKIFDLFNNTLMSANDTIKAENNYWGTTNLDTIESHIFHYTDSTVLGYVDYLPIRTITSVGNPGVKIDTYEFLNLYPNPFNPEVTIKFRIKNDGFTRIRIYDLLGREVMQIANEYLKAGEYERNWVSKGLASSVYIVRLETSLNTYAKRIAVIK